MSLREDLVRLEGALREEPGDWLLALHSVIDHLGSSANRRRWGAVCDQLYRTRFAMYQDHRSLDDPGWLAVVGHAIAGLPQGDLEC